MTTMDQSGQGTPSNVMPTEDGQQTDAPTAWLIRAGRKGQRYDYNIEHGLVGLGFGRVPDLRGFSSRQELADTLRLRSPDDTDGSISNRAGKLWRLRTDVRVGDLVVMPRMAEQIALGTVTREYWYDSDPDADLPHVVSVEWKRADMSRAAIKEDLLRSLPPRGTISAITRNDAPWRLQQLLETGRDPGARVGGATGSSGLGLDLAEELENQESELSLLVQQFRSASGYPTEEHEQQKRLQAEWAHKLASENISSFSRLDLTAITNFTNKRVWLSRYVCPVEGVMQWIEALDDSEYARLLQDIEYLCWGTDELWARFDRLTEWQGERRTKGFAHQNVSRVLKICHPEVFLPFDVQLGKWGRRTFLRRFNLADPKGSTVGQRVLDANDRIRRYLESYFGEDTLEMGAFAEWLLQQDTSVNVERAEANLAERGLGELADELMVEAQFLEDIVDLLADKGQVILYGPPGTGKTYLARELASELAPEESCRALVQFHPSTSYEDFFEGYRPAGTGDGGIRYELTPGPLARMAERASEAPDRQHVMIIDEINRGNLPRVLGELLFLLEYRDESVQTLYRPDEPFSLPENLWFLGTMNTADRSIALVDAALRRRFHFVPFFPDSGPMSGLLDRWLEREDEPAWVGHLVDAVNRELKEVLEGSHLLLGPSHFMKEYGSEADEQHQRLRRIWVYNIEPFIEDQFFGDPDQIERFRFDAVMARFGPPSWRQGGADGDPGEPDAAEASGGDEAFEGEGT